MKMMSLALAIAVLCMDNYGTTAMETALVVDECTAAGRDGGEETAEAACPGVTQVLHALHGKTDNLSKLLEDCTRPLLYVGYKWTAAEEANDYCKSTACVAVVKKLKTFPKATWEQIPSDSSDTELLMARRVMEDCA